MAGGARFIHGGKFGSYYRNAYNTAIEEVRSILKKNQDGAINWISSKVTDLCDDFVSSEAIIEALPKYTGNLRDSFGVAIFKEDTLFHRADNPAEATRVQHSSLELPTLEGIVTSTGGSYVVHGKTELDLLIERTDIPARVMREATEYLTPRLEGKVTALMYIAVPYARFFSDTELMEGLFYNLVVLPIRDRIEDWTA